MMRCACCAIVMLVRHENDRVSLIVQVCKERHDFLAGFRIEFPVGSSASTIEGELTSARATATALPLAAGKFIWFVFIRSIKVHALDAFFAFSIRSSERCAVVDQRQFNVVERRARGNRLNV